MDKYVKKIDALIEEERIIINLTMDTEILFTLSLFRGIHYNYESTNLSPRMIHYYIKEGVIMSAENVSSGRRKFNFFQVLWLQMVENLRTMGYSLQNIKAIRERLFRTPYFDELDKEHSKFDDFSMFEFIITLSLLSNDQIYFIALQDGRYSFVSDRSILIYTMDDTYLQEPHINLPLAHLIKGLFDIIPKESPNSHLSYKYEKSIYEKLTQDEANVVKDIRRGIYDQITVTFNNGKIKKISKVNTVETSKEIGEILKSDDYQDISLKVRDGKVVKIIRETIVLSK